MFLSYLKKQKKKKNYFIFLLSKHSGQFSMIFLGIWKKKKVTQKEMIVIQHNHSRKRIKITNEEKFQPKTASNRAWEDTQVVQYAHCRYDRHARKGGGKREKAKKNKITGFGHGTTVRDETIKILPFKKKKRKRESKGEKKKRWQCRRLFATAATFVQL